MQDLKTITTTLQNKGHHSQQFFVIDLQASGFDWSTILPASNRRTVGWMRQDLHFLQFVKFLLCFVGSRVRRSQHGHSKPVQSEAHPQSSTRRKSSPTLRKNLDAEPTASAGCDRRSTSIFHAKSQYASETDHPMDFLTIDGRLQHDAWLALRSNSVDPGEASCA